MRLIILIGGWLLAINVWGQSVKLDSLTRVVQRFYNAQQPDSLYSRLSPDFQQQVSLAVWRTFLAGTYTQAGRWQRHDYVRQQGGFSEYRSTFERGIWLIKIATNTTGKLTGFGLSPIVESKQLATDNPRRTTLDKQLDSLVRVNAQQQIMIGLSIGLIRHDSLFVYNYGETSRTAGQLPTDSTLYEIGSISKTFTATILADYIVRGLVKLDDPVNQYLPDSTPTLQRDGAVITLRMLANHTSGLPRLPNNLMGLDYQLNNPYRAYDTNKLFSFLKTVSLTSKPGTTYQYSNLGTSLLGTILERISGKSYSQLLRSTITAPLAMNQTTLTLLSTDSRRLALGYTENGQLTTNWDFQALAGAGGIRSTVHDMLRYLHAELNNSPEALGMAMQTTQTLTFQDDNAKIGLGWHQSKSKTGWWHNGGTGGYVSFASFDRPSRTAMIILSNTAISIDKLALAISHLSTH